MEVDGEGGDAAGEAPRGAAISVIAVPLASSKLTKRLYKLSKKASASKMLKRGVKEVVKALRKGEKGCVRRVGSTRLSPAKGSRPGAPP